MLIYVILIIMNYDISNCKFVIGTYAHLKLILTVLVKSLNMLIRC